jgi:hypothetical protein
MRSCYFLNLFSFGCLPDDDEPSLLSNLLFFIFLDRKRRMSEAMLCCAVFGDGQREAVSLFLVGP